MQKESLKMTNLNFVPIFLVFPGLSNHIEMKHGGVLSRPLVRRSCNHDLPDESSPKLKGGNGG